MIHAMADPVEMLSRVPLFSKVKPKELRRLVQRMSERTFNEGDLAVQEGAGGAGFWLIQEGNATVSIRGEIVRTLGPGDHFGEIALLDEGPRSATVTATTDLRCLGMAAWEFRPFIEEHPDAAWAIMQTLARRLREAQS
jgi:CRP/FNR family transcriptional regulator